MSDIVERKEFKLVESDELFWDNLREVSEQLGWESGQTLKACFALGWEQLSQRIIIEQKENKNDEEQLEYQ
ncbi:MAG: hypothetical protein H8D34_05315 [Chloroflexi bacterium]|nr:hypothetical protein [Chloroflexota bacterium]